MATIKSATAAIAIIGLASVGATSALAQSGCDARDKILSSLSQDYKEVPVGIGLTQTGRAVELLVSRKGSWTLLATTPSGVSCLIAAGDNWEAMPLPIGERS